MSKSDKIRIKKHQVRQVDDRRGYNIYCIRIIDAISAKVLDKVLVTIKQNGEQSSST